MDKGEKINATQKNKRAKFSKKQKAANAAAASLRARATKSENAAIQNPTKSENPTGSNKKSKPNMKSEVDTDDSDYTASPEKPAKEGKICIMQLYPMYLTDHMLRSSGVVAI
jgi:hypothetical protein